jgi:hypothetical protein
MKFQSLKVIGQMYIDGDIVGIECGHTKDIHQVVMGMYIVQIHRSLMQSQQ